MRPATRATLAFVVAGLVVAGLVGTARTQEPRPPAAARTGEAVSPIRPGVAADSAYGCVVCHSDKRKAFVTGIHSERGIHCDDCHGGNPAALEAEPAHAGNFIGTPDKVEVVRLCGSCHSDVERMRPFGLPADQVAEFRTSRHGQLLLEQGNTDAPTCSDCHDAHTILPPEDTRSSVHPARIPYTCARCHADEEHMAPYDIGTGQFEDYRQSAHGVALFQDGNLAAPTCVGCHGSHSALPPRVMQIANVCGRCHVRVRAAFEQGPHEAAAEDGRIAGCTACHDNHETEVVPPEEIAGTCTQCHEPDSPGARAGLEIQERMVRAARELEEAENALTYMTRAGRSVHTERFRYQSARTAFLQFQQLQHGLDLDRMEALSLRIASITGDIRSASESVQERRWEHRLLLAPIWFLALAAVVLAWFRLRERRRGGDPEDRWQRAGDEDEDEEPDEKPDDEEEESW